MRRVLLLLIVIAGIVFLTINGIKAKVKHDFAQPFASTSQIQDQKTVKRDHATGNDKTSLLVPYWTLSNTDFSKETYDTYLYFGITPTKTGINMDEAGYSRMSQFTTAVPQGSKKLLVIRMITS